MSALCCLLASLLTLASAQAWRGLPGSVYGLSQPWGDPGAAAWPVAEVGQAIQPQKPDDELKRMLGEVDRKRVEHIVTTLAAFGTRHTLSSQTDPKRGIGAARNWIYKEMQDLAKPSDGKLEVFFNSYIQPVASRISFPVNITNVVARINGTEHSNRVHVVTGHYDSRALDVMDYTGDAPGADDDATGVAVVMEMARICATRRPKTTMIFAAVAGEEQGLYGSDHLAKTLKNGSFDVLNWNNDIIGTGKTDPAPINNYTIRLFGASVLYPNASTAAQTRTIGSIGGENDSPARNLGRFIAEVAAGAAEHVDMQVALVYRPDRYLRGGDHQSFLLQGFPAVRFTEAVEDFLHQHQDPRMLNGTQYGDLLQYVDFEYVVRVAKVNLASMWSAANAPGMPRNVSISRVVGFPAAAPDTPLEDISNDSRFDWAVGGDTLAARYELVYRPAGALQWTHSLDVGNVSTVTVPLNKDNVQFGIRAVGVDGRKSPAVFPLPGGTG